MTDYPEALVECVARSIAHSRGKPDDKPIPLGYRADARAALDARLLREAIEALEAIRAMIPAIARGDRNVIDIADIIYPLLARIKGEPHA